MEPSPLERATVAADPVPGNYHIHYGMRAAIWPSIWPAPVLARAG